MRENDVELVEIMSHSLMTLYMVNCSRHLASGQYLINNFIENHENNKQKHINCQLFKKHYQLIKSKKIYIN